MSSSVDETVKVSAEEELAKVEEQTPPDPSQVVADALKGFAGAPSKDQIEAWKTQFGEVFCSGFAETELYIWRTVLRSEFVELQSQLAGSDAPVSALQAEDMVVNMCLLWSSEQGKKALKTKAGSMSALHEQIMSNSNFMDPRLATALVIKL